MRTHGRVAIARLFQETNALSPVPTEADAFRRFEHVGNDLLTRCGPRQAEVPGLWFNAELSGFCRRLPRVWPGVSIVPLFSAVAVPGGKVPQSVFQTYVDRLVEGVRSALPLDAVYLALHGAMGVVDEADPEAVVMQAVRDVVGPDVPIVVSFDLHGFLTPARVRLMDGFLAYRTFPHRDQVTIGARAAELVARLARREVQPVHAFRSLPMVLGGVPNVDFLAPMRGVYRLLRRIESHPDVVNANVLCCQPWHDAPTLGWSAHVSTHQAPQLAEDFADALADALWGVRHHLPHAYYRDVSESVDRARRAHVRRRLGTMVLSDVSDAVGAGGVGENTGVLRALVEDAPELSCVVPIRDTVVVEEAWTAPVGRRIDVQLGGRLAPAWYTPYGVRATVLDKFEDTQLGGRTVVLGLGRTHAVVTASAPIAISPAFFRDVGLRPVHYDLCVVKSIVAFRFYFLLQNRLSLWGRTRGVTDFDAVASLPHEGPVHPFVEVDDWRPEDRRRRALPSLG